MKLSRMPLLLVGLIWTCTTLGVERRVEGHLQMEGIPPVPQHTRERLDPYRNARSALLTSWLPDGGLLWFGYTDVERPLVIEGGRSYQLHAVREPMGARTQLTFFTEPVMTAAASPSAPGAPIAYLRDVGGNEDYQIFLLDPSSGRSTMISDGEARHTDLRWSNGGRRLAYSGNARVMNGGAMRAISRSWTGRATTAASSCATTGR